MQAVRDTASCGKQKVLLPLKLAKKRFGDLDNWAGGPKYEKIAEEERAAVREECRQAIRDLRESLAPKFGGEKLTDKAQRAADWAGQAKERITTGRGKADRALAIDADERRLYTEEMGIVGRGRLPEVELEKSNVPNPWVEDDDGKILFGKPVPTPPDPWEQTLDDLAGAAYDSPDVTPTAWDPPPAPAYDQAAPYTESDNDYFRDLGGPDDYQGALDAFDQQLDQQEAEAHQRAERERLQQEAKAREAEAKAQEAEAARERREREQQEREEAAWRTKAEYRRRQQQALESLSKSLGTVIGTAVAPSRGGSTGSSSSRGGSTGSSSSRGGSTGSSKYQPPNSSRPPIPGSCIGILDHERIMTGTYEFWDRICREGGQELREEVSKLRGR